MVRDRIKELRRVPASELKRNEKNFRTHPHNQAEALRGVLDEIGYADALIARELDDGTLELIDGHLRAETSADDEVPVLVLDVTQEEADKLLATFDPMTGLAGVDPTKLNELIDGMEFDSAALRRMVDDLANGHPEIDELVEQQGKVAENAIDIDKMELQPEEHYDFILVLADNVNDWNRLVELLDLPEARLSRTHRRLGIARATRARKILELIDGK